MQGSALLLPRLPRTPSSTQANNKLPCLPYERTYTQCLNTYGVKGAQQVPECKQIYEFFTQCVKLNKYFGLLKLWNPESFAENEYSRDKPNLEDIGL